MKLILRISATVRSTTPGIETNVLILEILVLIVFGQQIAWKRYEHDLAI